MSHYEGIRTASGDQVKGPVALSADALHALGHTIGEHSLTGGWDPSRILPEPGTADTTKPQVEGPAAFALGVIKQLGHSAKELLGQDEHAGFAALAEACTAKSPSRPEPTVL